MNKGRYRGFPICGKTIQEYRISQGMSQTELANKIKMSLRAIQRIETDLDYRVSRKTAYKLAYQIHHNPVPEEEKPVWELVNKLRKEEV